MAQDNPILRHWHLELQIFLKKFSLLQQQISADAVHDFRVAVKKLRSYFSLSLALSGQRRDKASFAQTRELFSVFGRHRNIEISRKLLLSFAGKNKEPVSPVLKYLQSIQDQVSQYCRRSIRQYEKQELDTLTSRVEKAFENFTTDDLINKTVNLVASSMSNIKENLKHFDERSHLIRKGLKDIYYRAKIFEDDRALSKSKLKSIDKILDHLGNVQDHDVMIKNLKGFRQTILSKGSGEYEFIKRIEARAKKKKKSLLEKAHEITHNLMAES